MCDYARSSASALSASGNWNPDSAGTTSKPNGGQSAAVCVSGNSSSVWARLSLARHSGESRNPAPCLCFIFFFQVQSNQTNTPQVTRPLRIRQLLLHSSTSGIPAIACARPFGLFLHALAASHGVPFGGILPQKPRFFALRSFSCSSFRRKPESSSFGFRSSLRCSSFRRKPESSSLLLLLLLFVIELQSFRSSFGRAGHSLFL